MSIRWIRNLLIEGVPSSVEVFLGQHTIADKCYVRYDGGDEIWFSPCSEEREKVLEQGKSILQKRLSNQKITSLDGQSFKW